MGHQLHIFFLLIFNEVSGCFCNEEHGGFKILSFAWEEVDKPFMITVWLLVAALAKILFHLSKPIATYLPDSSLLVVIGLVIGAILKEANIGFNLDSKIFFLYLLPPIIFDAGYFMPNRALFENMDSILLFSVVGTIWNTFAIGGTLYILKHFSIFTMGFEIFEIFVFSALISAVDPVAVIAIFEEINVNEFLFINVFGEALFNDAVTLVLYQMFKAFYEVGPDNLGYSDYFSGFIRFFVVAFGGIFIGVVFALITALITKYSHVVRIIAPVFIFVVPYMAYLTAEMLSFSAFIAIAVCGMTMKQYIKGNLSQAAVNSVKYFTKMLAQSTETVIFMFLGISTLSSQHYFDVWFIVSTLILCLLYRTIGVLAQCWFLNKFRHKKFSKVDQFILSYGGLRGAIAFGLAVSIPDSIEAKPMFVTTTIIVIFFNVFLQGITIRPLVNYLKVERKEEHSPTMTECVYNKYLDYIMSGLEDIAGQQGHYSFRDNYERFNSKILRPILLRNETKKDFDASCIVRAYAKITLEDALNLTKLQPTHRQIDAVKKADSPFRSRTFTNDAFDKQGESLSVPGKEHQVQKILESGENVEALYSLFSDLLDRKLHEMNTSRANARDLDNDDIRDDYMQQISSSHGSFTNLRNDSMPESDFMRTGRRQSTGGMNEKRITNNDLAPN
ncbi:unnamed protein product [Auanema sp. JU1783]|nr:unnamed protein product [Auanema sp. JU1783]